MKIFKILAFFGLIAILFLAAFYASILVAYRDGKNCRCYGIEINNKCLGIQTICTGLAPPILDEESEYKGPENCNNKRDEDTLVINFAECKNCLENIYVAFGSTTYEMYKSQNDNYCIMRYGREIENPNWKGDLNTICTIPRNIGVKTFKIGNYGVDFSSLEAYCK